MPSNSSIVMTVEMLFLLAAWSCLAWWAGLVPQTSNFEDLSRRASEAIDSDPAQAASLYRQALQLRPSWAEGWMYRGAALYQLHRYQEAREALLKGASLDASKGTPFAFLGLVDYDDGKYQAALADILKGESIGLPDNPGFLREVRYRAALVYLRSSKFGEALGQLYPLAQRNLQSDGVVTALGLSALGLPYLPSNLPAERQRLVNLAGRAVWALLEQRYEEAGPLFQQLLADFADQPGVHYAAGVYLLARDQLPEAEKEFREEIRLSPDSVLARVQLADLQRKSGNREGAISTASAAARLAPTDAFCQATLGRALLDAGRTPEAIQALERAERLAPQAVKVHFYLLQAYRKMGRSADEQREKALWQKLHGEQAPTSILTLVDP